MCRSVCVWKVVVVVRGNSQPLYISFCNSLRPCLTECPVLGHLWVSVTASFSSPWRAPQTDKEIDAAAARCACPPRLASRQGTSCALKDLCHTPQRLCPGPGGEGEDGGGGGAGRVLGPVAEAVAVVAVGVFAQGTVYILLLIA